MAQVKNIFMARQPVLDRNKEIYGYELLFRSGTDNFFDLSIDQDYASSRTISDSFLNFNIKDVTGGSRGFLNFTETVLLKDIATLIPKESVVVELLENVKPTEEVIRAFAKLKEEGYVLALDDFEFSPEYQPLIDLADIIKIDFMNTSIMKRRQIIRQIGTEGKKFLAEKVETYSEFQDALDMGYSYFQGYFFQKPVIVTGKEIKGYKLNILEIMKELNSPEIDIGKVENVVRRDVALTYKLLRFINSASLGVVRTVTSVKHAINLIGLHEFRKWVTMMLMIQLGDDKPVALMKNSIIRAVFSETVANSMENRSYISSDYFLLGLFSLIDAYLDKPMEEVVQELPIEDHLKKALQGKEDNLRVGLDIFICIEESRWEDATDICRKFGLNEDIIGTLYLESILKGESFY